MIGHAARPRWAAVVVNHNAGDLLLECARSLLAGGPDPDDGPDLVVVDNASTDSSVDALAEELPDIPVIRSRVNLGYARAANLGAAATAAPVILVSNPDVVFRAGAAGAALARFVEPSIAAVGPLIFEVDGSVYPSARREPGIVDAVGHGLVGLVRPDNPWTRRYRELDVDPHVARDVDWVSGAALWLRREALDAVGGWDEEFFMYAEDVDLCRRLRGAGWRVVFEPGAEVTHVGGASTAGRPYRMIVEHHRSLFRFASKHWSGVRRVLLPAAAVILAVRAALAMVANLVREVVGQDTSSLHPVDP
ncbi:MAG: glycosyltransferase family 2 protein [Acidimicrobiia bacterium]